MLLFASEIRPVGEGRGGGGGGGGREVEVVAETGVLQQTRACAKRSTYK